MSSTSSNDCINATCPLKYGSIDEFLADLSPATSDDALQMLDVYYPFTINPLLQSTPDSVINGVYVRAIVPGLFSWLQINSATLAMLSVVRAERGRPVTNRFTFRTCTRVNLSN